VRAQASSPNRAPTGILLAQEEAFDADTQPGGPFAGTVAGVSCRSRRRRHHALKQRAALALPDTDGRADGRSLEFTRPRWRAIVACDCGRTSAGLRSVPVSLFAKLMANSGTARSDDDSGGATNVSELPVAPGTLDNAESPSVVPVVVQDLMKSYGSHCAVDGVSFVVHRGEIHGLLGPNGAGKTTTLECVLGLRSPDAGTVRVFDLDPQLHHCQVFAHVGAYLQEDAGLYRRIRVAEALQLYSAFYAHPEPIDKLARDFGLTEKLKASYGSLSGGQKTRLHMALATIGRPLLLVLDEPTAGLDPAGRREVWSLIREAAASRRLTVLVSTHHLDEAEQYCDSVSILDRGKLVLHGPPDQLLTDHGFLTHAEISDGAFPDDIVTGASWHSQQRNTTEIVFASDASVQRLYNWAAQTLNHRALKVRAASLDDLFRAVTDKSDEL
jgi:ABC-2 type transport system ATP-binding protein